MRRLAMIFSVIFGVLLVLGLIELLTKYHWAQGDQDPLFGNPHVLLNDGTTVLIAAGLLVIGSVIMWILALRRGQGDQRGKPDAGRRDDVSFAYPGAATRGACGTWT